MSKFISMTDLILSKQSNDSDIKRYFESVLKLSDAGNEFPVELDLVWMLVYGRKEEAVRALTQDQQFIENVDYQVLRKIAENPKGGRPSNEYRLTISCMEFFIARKVRPVFEVYRQVFHKVAKRKAERPLPQATTSQVSNYELTSLDVASATGRRHNIVLKDIRRNLANGRLDAADFSLSTYMYGRHPYPCYRMTVAGCFDLACSMKPHNSRGMFALLKFRSLPQRPLLPSPQEAACEHTLADTLVDACCGLKALRTKHQDIAADILTVEKRLKNMLF